MSSYEDYARASAHYDLTRVPVGLEIILGCLAHHPAPLAERVLVDAGCGTGSYARALVDRMRRIEAVDLNAGMLAVARAKLADAEAAGRIAFHRASVDELPLPHDSVDAVMINQVLHHLPDDPSGGWPRVRGVLEGFARVLRPGGTLVVNISSHEQLRRGAWYAALIPEAIDRMAARHVPLDVLEEMLARAGFATHGRFVPVDAVVQGEHYFDPRGPFDARWRDGDSVWSTVAGDELEHVLARLRELDARGGLDVFFAEHDAARPHVGQITFIHATRL
ncbi:MAG: methyltransferase domain-containing protein [Gammaproteobacteria bacterium]|nr:methyltransferase domain-containing protein [Gammaproteobacteria bacterium]